MEDMSKDSTGWGTIDLNDINGLEGLPDYENLPKHFKFVLKEFFENKTPLEQILHHCEEKMKNEDGSYWYEYGSWNPAIAISERLIAGQKPENFKNKFYKTLKKVVKKPGEIRNFKPLFLRPNPVNYMDNSMLRFPYWEINLDRPLFDILDDNNNTKDMQSIIDAYYEFVGPAKKNPISAYFASELEKSKFAHCVRIAKHSDKITDDVKRQNVISAYFMAHAMSLIKPGEEEEYTLKDKYIPLYKNAVSILEKEKKKLLDVLEKIYVGSEDDKIPLIIPDIVQA